MKYNLKVLILAVFQFGFSFSHGASQISALHRALLDGYEKDAKPDGQVSVKFGIEIARINDLCAHKEVTFSIFPIHSRLRPFLIKF